MTDRFEGRRVAVTGAAGGIGLAICESLVDGGFSLR
jgi:NAD(P)-dependent dehydrogenase (short-subunit alcohol dehydrogenase family)